MNNQALQIHLNQLLAGESILALKTRNAHWNLISFHFKPFHEWLGELYNATNDHIDEIAERNRMIGGNATASMKHYLNENILSDHEDPITSENETLEILHKDHLILADHIRKGIQLADKLNDPGTEDFLTGLLQSHEKTIWFLRSHLEKK